MTDVTEFDVIGTKKLEDDAIGAINPKASHFVLFGMQLLGVERGVKWILSKEDRSWWRLSVEWAWGFS